MDAVGGRLHGKAAGFAGVVGIIAIITVVMSWFVVAQGLDAKGGTALGNAVVVAAALIGTAGCALYIYAIARGRLSWASLGLLGVVIAPTGFAYLGNVVALIAAVVLMAMGARENRRSSRTAVRD
jgi:hypothetical protein